MIATTLTLLNTAVALFASGGLLAVAFGYRKHVFERGTVTYHFALGMVSLAVAFAAQRVYWDGLWTALKALDQGLWLNWSQATGGTNINILFNLVVLFSTYHSLTALWLLIPEGERDGWSWRTAWLYPAKVALRRR